MKKIIAFAAIAAASVSLASAQDFKSGFFLDNYLYGYNINPALQADKYTGAYFGVGVSSLETSLNSNVGIDNFLFPKDGKLYLGLNKNISAEEFLGGLKKDNRAGVGVGYNIFSFGLRGAEGKSFVNVALNVRSQNGLSIPKGFFEFLKSGGEDNTYVFEDLSIKSKNYVELAVNYSRKIGIVTVGATVKGLGGIAYADVNIDRMALNIKDDVVRVSSKGSFNAALPYGKIKSDSEGYIDFSDIEKGSAGVAGYGAAVDLGVKVNLLPNLAVSAAVCDLGAVTWKKDQGGVMDSSYEFSWNDDDDAGENIEEMFKFKSVQYDKSEFEMLDTRINLGARYSFLFAPDLSVGALCTLRMGDKLSKNSDIRVGVTYTPGRIFSISGNYGLSSYGNAFGAAMNLRLLGINLFAGIDGIATKYTPQMIPVSSPDIVFKGGLSIVIGSKKANRD